MTKRTAMLFGAASVLGLWAGSAAAQTAVAPPADQGANATVVVIAHHEAIRLQKIPVAVSVFTGASRDRIGISTVQEVTNFAPGFVYDPSTVHAYIRGVGRQSVNVTDDQRVATYEDEFYVYSPYGLEKSSLFLSQEQIERGPQNVGGRQAAAGAIDMISVRPTDHPYAELRGTVSNFNHYELEGAASDEILPGVQARVSGFWNDQEQGFYKNVAGGPSEGNHIKEWYVEGQIQWKINDHSDFWVRGFSEGWNNADGDAGSRTGFTNGSWDEVNLTDGNDALAGGLFVNPNYGYAAFPGPTRNGAAANSLLTGDPLPVPGLTVLANPSVFNNPSATNQNNFAAILSRPVQLRGYDGVNYIYTYHFPNIDFKYIGGFQAYNYDLNYQDGDSNVRRFVLPGSSGLPAGLLAFLGLPPPTQLVINPVISAHYTEDDNWWSHEVSLQSTDTSPLQWIGGFFYYRQHYDQPYDETTPQQPQLSQPIQLFPLLFTGSLVPAAANPKRDILQLEYSFTVETWSPYAQVSYKINDQFKLTGALRFTHDHKFGNEDSRFVAFNNTFIDLFSPLFGAATPAVDETLAAICPTGNQASCFAGPLAKGVLTSSVLGADGVARRKLGDNSEAWTGGGGIEWTPTPDIFTYARYGRGYEPMSFNAGFNSAGPEVAPEYLNSYEVGYKQTFGRTLSIDLAAFYYDYDGFQQPISVNVGGTLQSEFINVPKAESTGVEFEGLWNPIKDLQVTGTYSYDYTAIVSGCTLGAATATLATGHTPGGNLCIVDTQDPNAVAAGARNVLAGLQSVKGDPLVNAPRNKVAVDVAYTWHFDPGNLTLSGAYVWRDIQAGTLFNRFYYNAPSWSDVDLRALWAGPHDRYEIIGFVKNVFNTTQHDTGAGGAALAGNNVTAGNFFVSSFNIAPPRQFGVEVRYKFF